MSYQNALDAYAQNQTTNRLSVSSPYRLTQMMFERLLDHMALANGALERGDIAEKGLHIGKAIDFLSAFRGALDLDIGGEMAVNLSRLYLFCIDALTQVNRTNDAQPLSDATDIVREIKTAWDELATSDEVDVWSTIPP